jgi:hypothetical protein
MQEMVKVIMAALPERALFHWLDNKKGKDQKEASLPAFLKSCRPSLAHRDKDVRSAIPQHPGALVVLWRDHPSCLTQLGTLSFAREENGRGLDR